MKTSVLLLAITSVAVVGCQASNAGSSTASSKNNRQSLSAETRALGITAVPTALATKYSANLGFDRYSKVTTPDGGAIHIIVQNQLSDNQIVRARSVLQHYLTDFPGSTYGADKSAVANKMVENNATLLLLNGSDDGRNPARDLDGQSLYQNEIQVEGGTWYQSQDFSHRDATFEEILHLVHDYGIGVDQNARFIGALPAYQANIRNAQVHAQTNKLWAFSADFQEWVTEITAENSLSQEYLASVIDSYYGLWGSWNGSTKYGMWGGYIAKTRDEIAVEDPVGNAVVKEFFHPYLTYNARIDSGFSGDFSLKFDAAKAYSHHSQYLKDVTLTGLNPSNVIVNQMDNQITGNQAENQVIFSGNSSQYQITKQPDGSTTVKDLVNSRDGVNYLKNIEKARFTDTVVSL